MKSLRAVLVTVCLVVGFSWSAFGQTDDPYVSSNGSDLNHCLVYAPCATFQAAFDKTLTVGSTIHVLDPGSYGTLTITHAVTIDGGNIATTLIGGGVTDAVGPQFTITAGASDVVTIENFTIGGQHGMQSAILVTSIGGLHVKHCTFNGFMNAAIDFEAPGASLEMTDVTISDIQNGTGVYVANARASLDNVHIHHTQTAVLAAGSSTVSVRRSTFNGNAQALAAAYGPTAELHVDDCMMTNNEWAVVVSQGAKAYLSRSSLSNNVISALFNDGSSFLISYGDNRFAGNASDGAFTSSASTK